MPKWRLAHSLEQLRSELNARWPDRDKSSDGAIGDAAHASTWSDHNPNAAGVVCAYDIDTDLDGTNDSNDPEMVALVEWIRTHPHPDLKYVIFRGRMFSAYPANGHAPFEWRPYSGDSHVSHPHVSVGLGRDGRSTPPYDDTTPWLTGFGTTGPEEDFMAALTDDEQRALATRVEAIQQQADRLEHALKTFLGDEDGTDERVALFDPKNGLYAKVTALDSKVDAIAKKVGA